MMYIAAGLVCAAAGACYYVPHKVSQLRPKKEDEESILFYDGVCKLCHGFVGFALHHDSNERVKFGPMQLHGERMKALGAGDYAPGGEHFLRTVVLVQEGAVYVRSDAALRVIALLDAPYKYLAVAHALPVGIRDRGYKLVAKWRYRVFGATDDVLDPPPKFKARFLEE